MADCMGIRASLDRGMSNDPEDIPDEIEVTPEMIAAGADAIFRLREELTAWSLARETYRAMEQEKRGPKRMTT